MRHSVTARCCHRVAGLKYCILLVYFFLSLYFTGSNNVDNKSVLEELLCWT